MRYSNSDRAKALQQRISTARLTFPGAGGEIYSPDRNDWAGRVGISYRAIGPDKLVLRGAFGTFYDRIFDNAWLNVRNNNVALPGCVYNLNSEL